LKCDKCLKNGNHRIPYTPYERRRYEAVHVYDRTYVILRASYAGTVFDGVCPSCVCQSVCLFPKRLKNY